MHEIWSKKPMKASKNENEEDVLTNEIKQKIRPMAYENDSNESAVWSGSILFAQT